MRKYGISLLLLAVAASACVSAANRQPRPSRLGPSAQAADAWKCPATADKEKLAQTAAASRRGCVTINEKKSRRARLFADDSAFANVCPIVVTENFSYTSSCTKVDLPRIIKGDTIDLTYRNGTYWLNVYGDQGSIVSGVKLMPQFVRLGSGAGAVEGYGWLKGSEGGVVYYLYIDGALAHLPANNDKSYILEIYDAANTSCASHAPDASAAADPGCDEVFNEERADPRQGGTGPGGEPPPTPR